VRVASHLTDFSQVRLRSQTLNMLNVVVVDHGLLLELLALELALNIGLRNFGRGRNVRLLHHSVLSLLRLVNIVVFNAGILYR